MIRTIMAAALALAVTLFTAPVQAAQRDRVFVASYGNDANPCTFGSPCKTFQNAVNVVAAGGEVTAIDSAGFGPIVINKSVTITSPAGVEAGVVPAAGSDAIDINAEPTDEIILSGLTLNGSGVGYNGVVFNSGASLTVSDCVVRNFNNSDPGATDVGILLQPSSGTISFVITNTTVSNNSYAGVLYRPASGSATANGVIDHLVAPNNYFGILIDTSSGGGSTTLAITNGVVSNNSRAAIYIINVAAPLAVSIDNIDVNGNPYGIVAYGTSNVMLGRSVITDNSIDGILNGTSPNTFYSYQDNRINGNATSGTGSDIPSPLNYTRTLK